MSAWTTYNYAAWHCCLGFDVWVDMLFLGLAGLLSVQKKFSMCFMLECAERS